MVTETWWKILNIWRFGNILKGDISQNDHKCNKINWKSEKNKQKKPNKNDRSKSELALHLVVEKN